MFDAADGPTWDDALSRERQAEYGLWIATTYRGFMSLSEAFLSFHFDLPDLLIDAEHPRLP